MTFEEKEIRNKSGEKRVICTVIHLFHFDNVASIFMGGHMDAKQLQSLNQNMNLAISMLFQLEMAISAKYISHIQDRKSLKPLSKLIYDILIK